MLSLIVGTRHRSEGQTVCGKLPVGKAFGTSKSGWIIWRHFDTDSTKFSGVKFIKLFASSSMLLKWKLIFYWNLHHAVDKPIVLPADLPQRMYNNIVYFVHVCYYFQNYMRGGCTVSSPSPILSRKQTNNYTTQKLINNNTNMYKFSFILYFYFSWINFGHNRLIQVQ